jgi:hypothetical protein
VRREVLASCGHTAAVTFSANTSSEQVDDTLQLLRELDCAECSLRHDCDEDAGLDRQEGVCRNQY